MTTNDPKAKHPADILRGAFHDVRIAPGSVVVGALKGYDEYARTSRWDDPQEAAPSEKINAEWTRRYDYAMDVVPHAGHYVAVPKRKPHLRLHVMWGKFSQRLYWRVTYDGRPAQSLCRWSPECDAAIRLATHTTKLGLWD